MSLDNLYPFAGRHAIQSAIFALEWGAPLTAANLSSVKDAVVPALKPSFPHLQEKKAITVVSGLGAPSITTDEIGGYVLLPSTAAVDPKRSIQISRESCLIQIGDYDRWASVKSAVDRYLEALVPAITKHLPINMVGLQYNDSFSWKGDPSQLPLREVFNPETKYLPSHVFETELEWHAHHGYFTNVTGGKQLDNINVSRTASAGVSVLQILTSHRAMYGSPLWLRDMQEILDCHERQHTRNKDILRDLLGPGVRDMIQLDKKQEAMNGT